jgi:chromosomal replication initiation ATPase DnaA
MTQPELIALEIKKALNVDIYDKRKFQDIVDARSIYCHILRNDLNFTLYEIRDSFNMKGKDYHHASVLHSEKMFKEALLRKPHFEYIKDNILSLISPKHALIKAINKLDDEKIKLVENYINTIL